MSTNRELWPRVRPILIGAAVIVGIPLLAAPFVADLFEQDLLWQQMLTGPAPDPVFIDPDWRDMPYLKWRLRDAQWQNERTVAPNTGDVITTSSATYAGREFWTISTTEAGQ